MDEQDTLLICPYNQSHRIVKSEMQNHLIHYCVNRPWNNWKMETCPYDTSHVISNETFPYHLENCFKRATLEKLITSQEPNQSAGAECIDNIINVVSVPPQNDNCDNMDAMDEQDTLLICPYNQSHRICQKRDAKSLDTLLC
ncbi:gametocyte-specific factor 1-like [Leptopilina heterotoma]|uniref:gametocyte-specific factor 1-like n=1 Tax=Leptopilina heterotoma TaxID=63436 RepID=UPI001CA8B699|nr:gametocyte-specific factor 1-like [Leptopilina heterotoma]